MTLGLVAPETERSDGENPIVGLVDISDVPYATLVERMTAVHGTANPRHAASAAP